MKVLVTGASGFLGGRLAQLLVDAGRQVRILARPTARLEHLARLPIEILPGGLADTAALARACQDTEVIYHCAGCSTDWAPWTTYLETNVTGTANLIAAARASGSLGRFVHVSTTDVYGYPAIPPDESAGPVDTGLPYNRSKLMGERLVVHSGLPFTVLRPASIYGPRGQAFTVDFATHLRQGTMAVIGGGRTRAGLAYIDNVAEAMIQASGSLAALGRVYNIADGTGVTWRQYVDALARGLGTRRAWINLPAPLALALARAMEALPGRPMLTRHAVYILCRDQEYPTARAREDFGFSPRVRFDEGLERSVEWLKAAAVRPS
jgi:nucleoside-diphosphate-sugar epimerase